MARGSVLPSIIGNRASVSFKPRHVINPTSPTLASERPSPITACIENRRLTPVIGLSVLKWNIALKLNVTPCAKPSPTPTAGRISINGSTL